MEKKKILHVICNFSHFLEKNIKKDLPDLVGQQTVDSLNKIKRIQRISRARLRRG